MYFWGWSLFSLVPWLLNSRRNVRRACIWLSSIQLLTSPSGDAFDCHLFGDVWTEDPIPHVDKSYGFIEFNFPSVEEAGRAKVVRKKRASTFLFAPKRKKNLENKSFSRSALCQKWQEYCEYLHNS
jgi:hypothetical protein